MNKKYKDMVAFLEEIPGNEQEVREFAAQTESFGFWENTYEDIYQDYLSPKKLNHPL